MLLHYPDVIVLICGNYEIVLESVSPDPQGTYSLAFYLDKTHKGRIPYEFWYSPYGCAPCGLHTHCSDCRWCEDELPHMEEEQFIEEVEKWIKKEIKNFGRINIMIRPNKKA